MTIKEVVIEESWKKVLKDEFQKSYFLKIKEALINDYKKEVEIYPPAKEIFNAFNLTPFTNLKVVILGQDPYHGKGQAHGLCFSVKDEIKPPPSLKNIYKELKTAFDDFEIPQHGNLTNWAKQGVFLLNAMLTVKANQAASHQNIGWQNFTDAVIKTISEQKKGVVFMLWGNFAKKKSILIDESKHFILKAAHPSPFSAHSGFFGCKHFSKANEILKKDGKEEIDWRL